MGPTVFERLVCLKDWIDAEDRLQYKEVEATTSGFETQSTETEANNESDDECDPREESGLWYMNPNY